jgi:hypothetical protein
MRNRRTAALGFVLLVPRPVRIIIYALVVGFIIYATSFHP